MRGFGLIEVVLGVAIASLSLIGIFAVTQQSLRLSEYSLKESQASFLLEEGAEAVRSIRDNGWSNISSLTASTTYYLTFTSGASARFATTTVNAYVDGFERTITPYDVYRDGSDDIAPSGTLDSGTRRIKVDVSWLNRGATTTRSLELYLSNI